MNKLLEILKELFGLTDEQLEKAKSEEVKPEDKTEDKTEDKPVEKEEEKTKPTGETVEEQSAGATSDTDKEAIDMSNYKELQEELKAVKEMLEAAKSETLAEKRKNKIQSIKDCVDYDILTTLLDGVEEKDFDTKVAEIQKNKSYLFKSKETDGFNPATPQNTMSDVEAAFYAKNPDLKG